MSFKEIALSGFLWSFIERSLNQGIGFFVSVIMARILLPKDFGLVAMVAIVIAIGQALRDSGMTQSLIRSNDLTEEDYSTVFLLNMAVSLLLYGLIYVFSPAVANFYGQPELIDILRLLSLQIPLGALSSIQNTRLVKEMAFKKQTMILLPAQLVSGGVGVYCAINGYGVWSLVAMTLAKTLVSSILLWWQSSWIPRLVFDSEKLKIHFNFGYKLTLSTLFNTIYQNLFRILIGKYYSSADLGYYSRAQSTRDMPVNNLASVLNKVTFPMFSQIKDDDTKLRSIYSRMMIQIVFWISPIMLLLALIAEPLFLLIYTEKWMSAIPLFKWLCIVGVLRPLNAYNLEILKVKGRSDLYLRLEVIKKLYTIILVFLLVTKGIMALIYLQVAASILGLFLNSFYTGRLISYSLLNQMKDCLPTFLWATLVFGGSYLLFSQYRDQFTDIFQVVLTSVVFIITYFCGAYLFKFRAIADFRTLILKR